ncbi:MAG: hypothetical protein Q9208_004735 [Pyrenodesmia sp. 3 TL-2023]
MVQSRSSVTVTESWAGTKEKSFGVVREYRQQVPLPTNRAGRLVKEGPLRSLTPTKISPLAPISSVRYPETTGQDPKAVDPAESLKPSRCPVAKEYHQARTHHPVLASTGCTKDFCQAGRAVHTDEPRIGENRAIEIVEKEAKGFLEELHREQFFATDEAFTSRLNGVLTEIRSNACEGFIRESRKHGTIGGNWDQTPAELEFGIRRAWRNARKCIMRSHSDELKLCDLRNVTKSTQMASELLQNMCEAFNGGNVVPTVFLFPPRKVNSRGPMIWNHQVLEFAGYQMEDGSILGDPASVELTKSCIDLGWEPPHAKTRWDLLPLVVMAENDVPAVVEVPSPLRDLIHIRHPRFGDEFAKLDLRWVSVPALTRLGFDIGGMQYTAAPFIGWFMDAEIGVRDLADSFRYNALPDVARALGLLNGRDEDVIEDLEDLPEYERLAVLSRAQTELTYAAHWSYQQAKVSMSDTLTASMKWCRYDDEFKAKHGFRLPADPYWLAPPQGSIVPTWHRGGAPNYQPKPMISKHVQDPLKAWEREKPDGFVVARHKIVAKMRPKRPGLQMRSTTNDDMLKTWGKSNVQDSPALHLPNPSDRPNTVLQTAVEEEKASADRPEFSMSVYFCSAGTFAEKTAVKLHGRLSDLSKSIPGVSVCTGIRTLNQLDPCTVRSNELVLAIVSSTGQGEVPTNGCQFIKICDNMPGNEVKVPKTSFRYAIYGNGDSRYSSTYNGAALIVEQRFRKLGGLAFAEGLYHGDSAIHATALQALRPWWAKLQPAIHDLATDSPKLKRSHSDQVVHGHLFEPVGYEVEAKSRFRLRSRQLLDGFHRGTVVTTSPSLREGYQGTHLVTLDVKDNLYEDLSCIQVLPINPPAKVRRALRALGVNASDITTMNISDMEKLTYSSLLTEYIDLEAPIRQFEWLDSLPPATKSPINRELLSPQSALDSLDRLYTAGILPADDTITTSICLALAPLHPRTYSVASSLSYTSPPTMKQRKSGIFPPVHNHLDILVKPFPQGRFSQAFLSCPSPTPLRYRLLPSSAASLLSLPPSTPLIIVATGAGFAPVRCLLQRRIAASRTSSSSNQGSSISLFLGLKPADVPLLSDILNEAAAEGLMNSMSIVSSNEEKVRVYDKLLEEATREKLKMAVGRGCWVFVCTNPEAAKGTRAAFEEVLGKGGIDGVGERWVEEIF